MTKGCAPHPAHFRSVMKPGSSRFCIRLQSSVPVFVYGLVPTKFLNLEQIFGYGCCFRHIPCPDILWLSWQQDTHRTLLISGQVMGLGSRRFAFGYVVRFPSPFTVWFLRIPAPGTDLRIHLSFPARFPGTNPMTYRDDRIYTVSPRFHFDYETLIRCFSIRLWRSEPVTKHDDRIAPIPVNFNHIMPSSLC